MGKNELKWNLEARINERFNGVFSLSFQNLIKNNSTRDCVMIHRKGHNYSPMVLFDAIVDMYNSCSSIDEVIDYLVNLTVSNPLSNHEDPTFDDPRKLRVTLISTENNIEYLKTVPHVGIPNTDLVAIFKYDISDEYTCAVTNQVIEQIPGYDVNSLFKTAIQNLNEQSILFISVIDQVIETNPELEDVPFDDVPLYILTNKDTQNYGASIILKNGCLDYVRNAVGDFYILPSSVHEVLVLPKYKNTETRADELLAMVKDVNNAVVDPEDRLSNNIYEYDGTALHMITEDDVYEEN